MIKDRRHDRVRALLLAAALRCEREDDAMTVPVPIPENLLPLVNKLTTLYAMEPVVADHIAPVINNMLDFALTSGKATDPKVWVRALQAAVIYVETRHADDQWLSATPINKSR